MATHSVRISLRVLVLQFGSALNPVARQTYLTPTEKGSIKQGIELPQSIIGQVEIDDGLESSTFSMVLRNAAYKRFSVDEHKDLRVDAVVQKGNVVVIYEGGQLIFAGWISQVRESGDAESGDADLLVSGGGLEEAMRQQSVFVDFGQSKSETAQAKPASIAAAGENKFSGSIATFAKTIKDFKQPYLVIQRLATTIASELLGGLYGGKKFQALVDLARGLTKDTYTTAFLHVLNWPKSVQIGQKISYWQLLQSFATPPLYELFMASDEKPYYMDAATTSEFPLLGPAVAESEPLDLRGAIGRLVFRKTPFSKLDSDFGTDALIYELDPGKIRRVDFSDSITDLFSGVHVSIGFLGNVVSVLANPPTYKPALIEQYGQRVLPIQLDGVQFPEQNEKPVNPLRSRLKAIQETVFDVFGGGERTIHGSIKIHYSARRVRDPITGLEKAGVSKGKILKIKPPTELEAVPLSLRKYEKTFYIEGVRTSFNPEAGEASQELRVKWGRRLDRSKPPDPQWVRQNYRQL